MNFFLCDLYGKSNLIFMKYLKDETFMMDMDGGEDTKQPTRLLENRIEDLRLQLIELPAGHDPLARADSAAVEERLLRRT